MAQARSRSQQSEISGRVANFDVQSLAQGGEGCFDEAQAGMMPEGKQAWHMSLGHSDAARELGFGNTGLEERII
jgi:hypothetical protein